MGAISTASTLLVPAYVMPSCMVLITVQQASLAWTHATSFSSPKSRVFQDHQPAAPQTQEVGSSAASTLSQQLGMSTTRSYQAATNADVRQHYATVRYDLSDASNQPLLWSIWAWNIVLWEVQHRPHTAHTGNMPDL